VVARSSQLARGSSRSYRVSCRSLAGLRRCLRAFRDSPESGQERGRCVPLVEEHISPTVMGQNLARQVSLGRAALQIESDFQRYPRDSISMPAQRGRPSGRRIGDLVSGRPEEATDLSVSKQIYTVVPSAPTAFHKGNASTLVGTRALASHPPRMACAMRPDQVRRVPESCGSVSD